MLCSILIQRFLLSLLTVFFALTPLHVRASALIPLTTISNPQLPNNTNTDINTNTTLSGDPPIKVVAMDAFHSIYFSKYQHLLPERNFFAAIVSIQTSLIAQYFERRIDMMYPGNVDFYAFGVRIEFDNPTKQLTYAVAHRLFGELAEFMMQGNFCQARFEMWEIRGGGGRQLVVGYIAPGNQPRAIA